MDDSNPYDMDVHEIATTNGIPAISPDCGDPYKHRACTGDAWDYYNDQPAPCECDCHLEAK